MRPKETPVLFCWTSGGNAELGAMLAHFSDRSRQVGDFDSIKFVHSNLQNIWTIYQATACSRRPPRDRTLALALLYVSLSPDLL